MGYPRPRTEEEEEGAEAGPVGHPARPREPQREVPHPPPPPPPPSPTPREEQEDEQDEPQGTGTYQRPPHAEEVPHRPGPRTPDELQAAAEYARLDEYFQTILENMDPARMGRRADWASALVHNGAYMGLLDVHETFAGAWPGQPGDGGTGGGGWLHAVREKMEERGVGWRWLKILNVRTEERLLRWYEEAMRAGTNQGALAKVEGLSLDVRLSADAWDALVEIFPRMRLYKLRLVAYPNDELWEAALRPGGALSKLLARLPLLHELIVDCPWDVQENECVCPGTVEEWAAVLAHAPNLGSFALPRAMVLTESASADTSPEVVGEDAAEPEDDEPDEDDAGYFSASEGSVTEMPPDRLAAPTSSLEAQDQLDVFAASLFAGLPPTATLEEVIFLPQRSFYATCTAQVYSRESGQGGVREEKYKRFWEYDWEDWEWVPGPGAKPRSCRWFEGRWPAPIASGEILVRQLPEPMQTEEEVGKKNQAMSE
ncbi:hypothetical protein OH77DRAFT_1426334 [Trametes cingulata]|nr:hypothetical protein OH77DRAFT_1426334 [Trametes cingulata]